ncbi:MAG: MBL fold metallo-hydrolase [Halobacteriaceae archaeon]
MADADATAADLEPLTDHLYRYADTCAAYALVDGDAALVVDPGSGAVADALADAGYDVEWALHTHHHRDTAWGTPALAEAGVDVAVPEHEAYLFEDVDTFWAKKRLYDNYNDRSTFYSLADPVPVDATLDDYETFSWRGHEFEVLPARGHTAGSSALLLDVDGRRVAFCGDLLRAGGRLHDLHSMEYEYSDMKGVPFTIQSAQALAAESPDLLCPGHGETSEDPVGDCARLVSRLTDVVDLGPHGDNPVETLDAGSRRYLPEMEMIQVSEHLLWGGPWTCSNFYVLRSDSGKALFVDYGHSMREHMLMARAREDQETFRFVEHHLDELREEWGITEFDVVIPTHIHDDHTVGIPHLQRQYDVDCWALDEVAKVIEEPAAWSSTPCVYPEPIDVSRTFGDGASFEWEEFAFDLYHAPGQTEFHSTLAVDVDGKRVAFTGDNYFVGDTEVYPGNVEPRPHQTTVLRNSFRFDMHQTCKRVLREVSPDLICPGHNEILDVDDRDVADYCDFVDRKERAFREAVADPAEQAVDLFWARLLPYQTAAETGESVTYALRVRNNFGRETTYEARLLAPDGRTPLSTGEATVEADDRGEIPLSVTVDGDWGPGREVLTAEVLVDGESRGPVVEAVLTVEE